MTKTLAEIDLSTLTFDELNAAILKAGGQRALSRLNGEPRSNIQLYRERAYLATFKHRPAPEASVETVDQGVRRFILTSAQDATKLDEGFLTCLETYRDWLQVDAPCEIMIAGFTYGKSLFEEHAKTAVHWPERIKGYMRNERVRLGDRIDWCAEMNTLPTATSPLTGFTTYTRERWGIFPHAKVQLLSVPTMKSDPAKIVMTTGACTKANYVQKRAGLVASFHHVIGAVLVEIDADGTFFCRHLLADDDGSFYDLDRHITAGKVTTDNRVKALNHGDLHIAQIDPDICEQTFGVRPNGERDRDGDRVWVRTDGETMLDALKPEFQFYHDSLDQQARNHHNVKDPHHMFMLHSRGIESVEGECHEVGRFIAMTRRSWCQTVMVESNHDLALKTWLKNSDWKYDPLNARFNLRCNLAILDAIHHRTPNFSIFEKVLREAADLTGVTFLRQDQSFVVAGIEKGMHGHLGANGARGAPAQFTRMGPKATTGHTHSCGILDGIYTAGTKSNLDLGYNLGLSSWTHSDVVTLPNGKRQIVTWNNNRWRL